MTALLLVAWFIAGRKPLGGGAYVALAVFGAIICLGCFWKSEGKQVMRNVLVG